jgi:hypothetical protein
MDKARTSPAFRGDKHMNRDRFPDFWRDDVIRPMQVALPRFLRVCVRASEVEGCHFEVDVPMVD